MSDLLRVSGIASGIDTVGLIEQLMAVERRPAVLMERQKLKLDWKKELWGEINTRLLSVKTALAPLLDRTKLLAKSATSSNESVLTAEASSTAATGTYKITVSRLATATVVTSGAGAAGLGLGRAVDTAQPVVSTASRFGTPVTAGTFTIAGVTITLDADDFLGNGTGGANDLIQKVNDALAAAGKSTITMRYDSATDKLTVTDTAGGPIEMGAVGDTSNFLSAAGLLAAPLTVSQDGTTSRTSTFHLGHVNPNQLLKDANFATAITDSGGGTTGTGSFKINGVEITFDLSNDTLNTVITRINNSAAGVVASYDAVQDRLILTAKTTGSLSITREDVAGTFLAATDLLAGATLTAGQNAEFTIEGLNGGNPLYSTSNDVTDVISGVTLHLRKADPLNPVTLTIGQDTQAVKDAIKAWVNAYNEAINLINTRLQEKTISNKKWEDMTDAERKQGLLRGDWALAQLKNDLVRRVTDVVEGLPSGFNQLALIGIKLSSDTGASAGNLTIDEAALDAALRDNPEKVADLFFRDADYDNIVDSGEVGVAVRVDALLKSLTDPSTVSVGGTSVKNGLIPRQQDVLTTQIEDLEERIERFDAWLQQREAYLVRQFTAMEQFIGLMQQQSSWLAAQTASLMGTFTSK
ncbi:MAG: flagellar filament capping protein FliD [Bacillota bacterium]|nr:flagellar filament capping protein FliD [Bacillota bacterium]